MFGKRGFFISILVVISILFIASTTFAASQINVLSYNYSDLVSDQDIEYFSCFDEPAENVHSLLSCDQEYLFEDVPVYKYNESCYYSSISVAQNTCSAYTIQTYYSSYGVDKVISERISVNKIVSNPKILIDNQKWDGSFGSASQTAYVVWVLSRYGSTYDREIEYSMAYLKDSRLNNQKCWYAIGDTASCSLGETAKTLAYLVQSNVSDKYRVVSDGKSYIESQLNYIDGDDWKITFTGKANNMYCNASFAGSSLFTNQEFDDDSSLTEDVTADYNRLLNFTCTDDVEITINNERGTQIFNERFDSLDSLDFDEYLDDEDSSDDDTNDTYDDMYKHVRIKPACWTSSSDKWDPCSQGTSAYALSVGIDTTMKAEALDWLESALINHSIVGRFVNSETPQEDTAYYIKTVNPTDTEAIEWLLYSQNNDGSFGTGTDAVKQQATAMAILALQNSTITQKEEAIADAKLWLSSKYSGSATSNILGDAALVQVLSQNAKPYLRLDQQGILVLSANAKKSLAIRNPSKYLLKNVTYTVISDIELTLSGPTVIPANNSITLDITSAQVKAGNHTGYISIKGAYDNVTTPREIRRIYFSLYQDEQLSISIPKEEYHSYEDQFSYILAIDTANTQYTCDVEWDSPYLTSTKKVQILKTGSVQIPVAVEATNGEIQTSGVLSCTVNGIIKTFELPLNLFVHTGLPYTVTPKDIYITSDKPVILKIENVGKNPMPVQLKLQLNDGLVHIDETSFIIPGRKTAKIPIRVVVDAESNATAVNLLTISAFDYETLIQITVEIQRKPFPIVLFVLAVMLVTIVGVGIYMRMHWAAYGPKIMPVVNPIIESVMKVFGKKIKLIKKKRDKKEEYMMGIVSIMKSMDKPENEIIARLESEGYTSAQINSVLENLGSFENQVSNIKHESKVLGIVRELGTDLETVSRLLKEKGYTESEIRDALQELAQDTEGKEKKLRKDAGIAEDEKL